MLGLVDRRLVSDYLLLNLEHVPRLRRLRHGHIIRLNLGLTLILLRVLVDLKTAGTLCRLLLLPIRALSKLLQQLLYIRCIVHLDLLNLLLVLNHTILGHALGFAMNLPPSSLR